MSYSLNSFIKCYLHIIMCSRLKLSDIIGMYYNYSNIKRLQYFYKIIYI